MTVRKSVWVFGLWIAFYALLIGCTLNNTYPLQGDESFYTVSAVAMVQHGQYLVPSYFGHPRLQKPILTYWLVAAAYKMFGISLWSGRIPILLLACLTLALVYGFAQLYIPDQQFGLFAVLLLSSTAMFITFSRIAMTDPVLTFFSTAALWCFGAAAQRPERRQWYHLCGYGAVALAFMSKGPAGLLPLVGYLLFLLVTRPVDLRTLLTSFCNPLNFLLLVLIIAPWYLYTYSTQAPAMLKHMSRESKAFSGFLPLSVIGKHLVFYLYTMLIFALPFSLIVVPKLFRHKPHLPQPLLLPVCYIVVVLICFTFFVQEHKDRYLCIIFPSLAVLMAYILYTTGPVRRYAMTAVAVTLLIGSGLIIYPLFPGEALRQVVAVWKQQPDGSIGVYDIETKRKGWVLLLTGGQAQVDSTETDYVITDHLGKDKLTGFTSLWAAPERERLRWENGRLVVVSRTYHLLRRAMP
jgi:4-amino-4-deoxy-L-arabinose transferase-like glycosyltransferase